MLTTNMPMRDLEIKGNGLVEHDIPNFRTTNFKVGIQTTGTDNSRLALNRITEMFFGIKELLGEEKMRQHWRPDVDIRTFSRLPNGESHWEVDFDDLDIAEGVEENIIEMIDIAAGDANWVVEWHNWGCCSDGRNEYLITKDMFKAGTPAKDTQEYNIIRLAFKFANDL